MRPRTHRSAKVRKRRVWLSLRSFVVPFLAWLAPRAAHLPWLAGLGGLYIWGFASNLFSPLYAALHGMLVAVWGVWMIALARDPLLVSTRGFRRTLSFLFILCIGLASAWGSGGDPSLRMWVSPPAYAPWRAASLHLFREKGGSSYLVPEGSVVHVSLEKGRRDLAAIWQGRETSLTPDGDGKVTLSLPVSVHETRETLVLTDGWRRLGVWPLEIVADAPPRIVWAEAPETTVRKTVRLVYDSSDDFGVEKIKVRVEPLSLEPGQAFVPVEKEIAAPRLSRSGGAGYVDLTSLPWAGQTVSLQLVAVDGAGQQSATVSKAYKIPERSFKNPLARALVEERAKLSTDPSLATRHEAANVMAGIARQYALFNADTATVMSLRSGAVRLVLDDGVSGLSPTRELLWQVALRLEEGALGLAREQMARGERDLADLLGHGGDAEGVQALLAFLRRTGRSYFEALEVEKKRLAPELQDLVWGPVRGTEPLVLEDYLSQIETLSHLLASGRLKEGHRTMADLQAMIENLRTTPPELDPEQERLARQVAEVRILVKKQKKLIEEISALSSPVGKGEAARRAHQDSLAQMAAEQERLLSRLRQIMGSTRFPQGELTDSGQAMASAVQALGDRQLDEARKQQAKAQALLENCLLLLSEKMRHSLTASGR